MRATDKQRGFTLLEIMVVIVIIGVLASLVVPNLMGNKEKADKQKAVSDIVALENALDMYKLDNHHYPTTNQGLESLVEAPTLPPLAANYNKEGYIKRLPADPWGNDYVLARVLATSSRPYVKSTTLAVIATSASTSIISSRVNPRC